MLFEFLTITIGIYFFVVPFFNHKFYPIKYKTMKQFFSFLMMCVTSQLNAQNLSWSTPVDVSTSAYSYLRPSIALDANSNPVILWSSMDSSAVFLTKWNGANFNAPKRVTPAGMNIFAADWAGPNFAVDGDKIYVVYKQTPEDMSNAWLSRSIDGGNSFTQTDIDDTGFVSRFPTVTVNNLGNPVVGFMKFDSGWANARWVVTRSMNGGNSFMPDVLAGNYSGGEACDCCPGTLVSNGNNMAMLYRDNNMDIRDTWCGISNDAGQSFPSGARLDYNNWFINSCPSTGPDGFIIGDTIYSVFMNAASGKSLVYYSTYNLTTNTFGYSNPFTGNFASLGLQNFPHISQLNNKIACVWKQTVNGSGQIIISYSNQNTGFQNLLLDTVAENASLGRYNNPDVVISNDKIFVVWQDNNSKTVKYSYASYNAANELSEYAPEKIPNLYYNNDKHILTIENSRNSTLKIINIEGKIIFESKINSGIQSISMAEMRSSFYVATIYSENKLSKSLKIIKN